MPDNSSDFSAFKAWLNQLTNAQTSVHSQVLDSWTEWFAGLQANGTYDEVKALIQSQLQKTDLNIGPLLEQCKAIIGVGKEDELTEIKRRLQALEVAMNTRKEPRDSSGDLP